MTNHPNRSRRPEWLVKATDASGKVHFTVALNDDTEAGAVSRGPAAYRRWLDRVWKNAEHPASRDHLKADEAATLAGLTFTAERR